MIREHPVKKPWCWSCVKIRETLTLITCPNQTFWHICVYYREICLTAVKASLCIFSMFSECSAFKQWWAIGEHTKGKNLALKICSCSHFLLNKGKLASWDLFLLPHFPPKCEWCKTKLMCFTKWSRLKTLLGHHLNTNTPVDICRCCCFWVGYPFANLYYYGSSIRCEHNLMVPIIEI